ncbi:P-loop containing nucleoside triphosphate hydrolase protein, partial [Massarina eburnea CBS 473.64]
MVVGYLTYLFDAYIGLIMTATYVFYGIVTYKLTPWVARERRKHQATRHIERNIYHESLANWVSAFDFNQQEYQKRRVEKNTYSGQREMERSYNIELVMNVLQSIVIFFGYCAFLFRAVYLVIKTQRTIGDFVTLLLFCSVFTAPLYKISHIYNTVADFCIDTERLLEVIRLRSTVTDAEDAYDLVHKGGEIEFRHVSFSYHDLNPVVQNLSFKIKPGTTMAFVGLSGSGKRTICNKLLFRGYDVTRGSILIDKQDIRGVTQKSLRDTIGIVRQEQSFYNDTLMEIVRYARLEATDDEVMEACKNAAIHDQILSFTKGYNSRLNERGVMLSVGGRQRLAIAQLFLRDPKIIVLNEATASVDNAIESETLDSFARISKSRTTLIVSHHLSTVQQADVICVMHQGHIAEQGTHQELLKLRGRYFILWNKKKTAEKLVKLEQELQRHYPTTDKASIDISDDDTDGH